MGQALYRKYRSKSFDEIVGQEHITKTLQNAIKQGKISHAYLLTGPRGVGKTSVARILAHEINQIPYDSEATHLDIIEIDAASNRRIDEIRDLRDKARIAPAAAKYKVYIIDEVHMLTKEAFNALLKTLEEPPAHCIFILATTEVHKLPDTIVSRTQRFEFKPVNKQQAAAHLKNLAKQEKIDIDLSAIELLAEFGNGSFRDSISYLDQLSATDQKITESVVRELLGLPSKNEIEQLMLSLNSGDAPHVMNQLTAIEQHGVSPATLADNLSSLIRTTIVSSKSDPWHYNLARKLLLVTTSSRPQELLEISLLEAAAERLTITPTLKGIIKSNSQQSIKEPKISSAITTQSNIISNNLNNSQIVEFNLDYWPNIVELSKAEAASIYTALRLAQPSYDGNVLNLSFQFPLHQKKLAQAKNKQLVANLIHAVYGVDVAIEVTVKEPDVNNDSLVKKQTNTKTEPTIMAINNIFGSSELLES